MRPWKLLRDVLLSGTLASWVMMPPGFIFQRFGMRVGHYGPKFAGLYLQDPTPGILFAQHMVLGWISVLPLLWLPLGTWTSRQSVLVGAMYGALFYISVNSLALPLYFGDPLPWQLGAATVLPSLVVHLVYGASAGWALWRLRRP